MPLSGLEYRKDSVDRGHNRFRVQQGIMEIARNKGMRQLRIIAQTDGQTEGVNQEWKSIYDSTSITIKMNGVNG